MEEVSSDRDRQLGDGRRAPVQALEALGRQHCRSSGCPVTCGPSWRGIGRAQGGTGRSLCPVASLGEAGHPFSWKVLGRGVGCGAVGIQNVYVWVLNRNNSCREFCQPFGWPCLSQQAPYEKPNLKQKWFLGVLTQITAKEFQSKAYTSVFL